MLRVAFLLLLLANGAYFGWSHGWLAALGLAPVSPSEPQRLTNQVQPASLRLLSGATTTANPRPEAAAPTPSQPAGCLLAGPFDGPQATALRKALAALPPGSWKLEEQVEPSRWMVYMGKYSDETALERKRSELRRRNVAFDTVTVPALQPGLSLGRYSSQANANTALKQLETKGVVSARVVVERAEVRSETLRLPAVDAALREQVDGLKAALAGKPLRGCS